MSCALQWSSGWGVCLSSSFLVHLVQEHLQRLNMCASVPVVHMQPCICNARQGMVCKSTPQLRGRISALNLVHCASSQCLCVVVIPPCCSPAGDC